MFIGQGLNPEAIKLGLDACLLTDTEADALAAAQGTNGGKGKGRKGKGKSVPALKLVDPLFGDDA